MSTIKFEGKTPEKERRRTYSVRDAEDMTIEELMERIRSKIKRIQEKNGTD